MSRFANCKWCNDRPGGCLYCIGELADSDAERLQLIDEAIAAGEVHVLAVRITQEFLLREVRRSGSTRGQTLASGGSPARQEPRPTKCMEHVWVFDRDNFKRRHCARPGCNARQVFQWLPESPDKNGHWIDLDKIVIPEFQTSRKRRARK